MSTDTLARATLDAIEGRIRDRIRDRRVWYRSHPIGRSWSDLAALNDIALRELFAVRREAKRTLRSHQAAVRDGEFYAGMPA